MPLISRLLPGFFALCFVLPLQAQHKGPVTTVVIDAGHGGKDPGALGKQVKEKDINLALALKLGDLIRKNFRDIKVIFTREKDVFVELYRRAEIANENKADLFISIHCNANRNPARKGAETYIMGLHKSEANLSIAKQENSAILLESDYQSTYKGFDPNADESYIIFSLYQNSNLGQSTDLAAAIQLQLAGDGEDGTRGVRQAGFMVLYKTAMPSVLIEAGYLSNPEEEQRLMTEAGQDAIAGSVFRAFEHFRKSLAPAVKPGDTVAGDNAAGGLVFKIQIAASKDEIDSRDRRLTRFRKVESYQNNGLFKYTFGNETTLEGARKLLKQAHEKGAQDAFIVIFRDGKRIPDAESKRILGK